MVNKVFLYNVSVKKKICFGSSQFIWKTEKNWIMINYYQLYNKKTELFLMLNAMTGQLLYISGFQGNFS